MSGRRRRADAERNKSALLDAAIALLGRRPDASTEEIAKAAGVTRQTVYAHYPSRDALLRAVVDRVTVEVTEALDRVDVDGGPAGAALGRWLETCWALLGRYPVLLTSAVQRATSHDEYEVHAPIIGSLVRVLRRGQDTGEFDPHTPTSWLVSAVIALGHAAGQEAGAGRMDLAAAGRAFRDTVLRVCRAP
jgi:AcrR family transcriptional regulator